MDIVVGIRTRLGLTNSPVVRDVQSGQDVAIPVIGPGTFFAQTPFHFSDTVEEHVSGLDWE